MDLLTALLVVLIMIILHETTHLTVAYILKVKIEAFLISYFGILFYLVDEDLVYSAFKIVAVSLTPLMLSLVVFFSQSPETLLFSISNLGGSLGDVYMTIKLLRKKPHERLRWGKHLKKKLAKKAIYIRKWKHSKNFLLTKVNENISHKIRQYLGVIALSPQPHDTLAFSSNVGSLYSFLSFRFLIYML